MTHCEIAKLLNNFVTMYSWEATSLRSKMSIQFLSLKNATLWTAPLLVVSSSYFRNVKCSLSDLLLWAVLPSIINALREVLDQANALSYADLLFFCQLGDQTSLAGCRMVHGHVSLLLVAQTGKQQYETKTCASPYKLTVCLKKVVRLD